VWYQKNVVFEYYGFVGEKEATRSLSGRLLMMILPVCTVVKPEQNQRDADQLCYPLFSLSSDFYLWMHKFDL
jgi:hypothetical protein